MPYTIVLTPSPTQSIKYIEASQSLYSKFAPNYLLSADGTSSPHITVVQFDCDSFELAFQVWEKLCGRMKNERFEPFAPLFIGVSFIEGVGLYDGTTWVELSVQRGDENSPLMKVHYAALEALKELKLKPLNAVGNNYRPHLTLARILMPEKMQVWPKSLLQNPGFFKLELGLSDEKWQYMRTLAIFEQHQ